MSQTLRHPEIFELGSLGLVVKHPNQCAIFPKTGSKDT